MHVYKALGPVSFFYLQQQEKQKAMQNKCAAELRLPQSITPLYHQPVVLCQLPPQTLKTLFKTWSSKRQQGQPGVKRLGQDCQRKEIYASK